MPGRDGARLRGYRMMSALSRRRTSSPITGAPGSSRPRAARPTFARPRAGASRPHPPSPRRRAGSTHCRFRRLPPGICPARRRPRALDERHCRMVDHRGDPAGPGQLEQVAEQAEPGHVGSAPDPGGQRLPARLGVQRGHHPDRSRADLARCLAPGIEHPRADRLGQAERQARLPGVNPQQRGRIRGAGHRHAVLRLRIIDAVAAGYVP
jgi:hypothetical protein